MKFLKLCIKNEKVLTNCLQPNIKFLVLFLKITRTIYKILEVIYNFQIVVYRHIQQVPKLFTTCWKRIQISEQSIEKNLEWAWTWLLKRQGHKNMLQDVQKISPKLLLIDIMCAVLSYDMIKNFADFTNHTYQNITKQMWHKIYSSSTIRHSMNI